MGTDIMIQLATLILSAIVAIISGMAAFHRMAKKQGSLETKMNNLSAAVDSHSDDIQSLRIKSAEDDGRIATLTALVENLCNEQRQANKEVKEDMRSMRTDFNSGMDSVNKRIDRLCQIMKPN